MATKACSVDGCAIPHEAKGYCSIHYARFKRHGDPLVVLKKPNGSGSITKDGYRLIRKNGVPVYEHIYKAELALGKSLPQLAVVHHVNGDKSDNRNCNLVVCKDEKYHRLIHMRMSAIASGSPAHYRKCPFCKEFDDPKNMGKVGTVSYGHRKCANDYRNNTQRMNENGQEDF